MYKFVFLCIISCVCICCNNDRDSNNLTDSSLSVYTYIRFSDSLFREPMDTLVIPISIDDTMALSKLNGYFKVFREDSDHYYMGLLKNGKRENVWLTYKSHNLYVLPQLVEKIDYRAGKFNGKYIEYHDDGTIVTDLSYINDTKVGLQKEYNRHSKTLALMYTTDSSGNYIDDYLALGEYGDTLFYVNLGEEGTGYLKIYDSWGIVQREGYLENGYMEMSKEYHYDSYRERYYEEFYYVDYNTFVLGRRVE